MAHPAKKMADCLDFGSISVTLSNLAALDDEQGKPQPFTSPTQTIGGLTWRIELHKKVCEKTGVATRMDLHVHCNEEVKEHLWLCKVLFTVHSGPARVPAHRLTYSYNHYYGFNTYYWILLDIFDREYRHNPNEPIEIKLDVNVCRAPQKSLPPIDTNLVINLGEHQTETLPVNKYALASMSSYFRNLFFEDWRERKEGGNSFEINEAEDMNIEAFRFMIYAAQTMGWMVHESNFLDHMLAVEIVKLGIKYDVFVLVDYCEKYLVQAKNRPQMELLDLAEQYNLTELKNYCLNELSLCDYMEDLAQSMEIHARLSKPTREELEAKLSEKARMARSELAQMDAQIRQAMCGIGTESTAPITIHALVSLFTRAMNSMLGHPPREENTP